MSLKNLLRAGWFRAGLLAWALAALSACNVLPKSEEITLYRLPAQQTAIKPKSTTAALEPLFIQTPFAAGPIAGSRVLVVPPNSNEISAYPAVRWQDNAPILLRHRLADAFRDTREFKAVVVDSKASYNAQYELSGELNAFQVEHPKGEPVVHLLFDAMVADRATGKTLASERFEIVEPVVGKAVPQVIEAFGRASDQLSQEVTKWALARLKAVQR